MNEILLSDDLKVIELEINHHKNIAGQSIWEIGRRLNHVKENDLAHGQFIDWLSSIQIEHTAAKRMMKVANELPNSATLHHLGESALYIIATLPEEERTKKQVTEKGEIKTPDEMTVRELQSLKKQLKEQSEQHQRQLAQKDEVINKTYEQLEKAQQEPKIIEKVVERIVEVVPDDYEELKLEALNSRIYKDELDRVQERLKFAETKYNLLESSTAEAKEMERNLRSMREEEKSILEKMQAIDDFIELEKEFNQFFDTKMAPMRFKSIANYLYATNAIERIKAMINQADLWVEEMNKLIPNSNIKIIEGEFTNE